MRVDPKSSMSRLALLYTIAFQGRRRLLFFLRPTEVKASAYYRDPKSRKMLLDLIASGQVEVTSWNDLCSDDLKVRITKTGVRELVSRWRTLSAETRSWLMSSARQEKG